MQKFTRRHAFKLAAATGVASFAMPSIVRAQSNQAIRIVYPYAGGSAVNNIIRMVAQSMSETLGQTVIVEDKPGGNGIVATQTIARSPKDGLHVLVGASGTLVLNSLLRNDLPYKLDDFQPVGMMLEGPLTVTVHASSPATDMKTMLAWAKQRGQPMRYATLGPGSVTHLFGVLLGKATGINGVAVAYRNNNAQILDLLAQQNELNFSTPASLLEHQKAGTVKMLAVTTEQRMPLIKDVPTVVEAGYPQLVCSFWNSLMVPTGTPKDVIAKLNNALNVATQKAEIRGRMESEGLVAMSGATTRVDDVMKRDLKLWGDIIREEKISLQ